jgi:hypothetical protein
MLPLPAVPIDVDKGTPFFGLALPGLIGAFKEKLALLQLSAEEAAAQAKARALRGDAYGTRQVRQTAGLLGVRGFQDGCVCVCCCPTFA